MKIPAGTGVSINSETGADQRVGSVFDPWVGSWVFLLLPLTLNIQSSFFKAQYRDFTLTSLKRVAVVSVSCLGEC